MQNDVWLRFDEARRLRKRFKSRNWPVPPDVEREYREAHSLWTGDVVGQAEASLTGISKKREAKIRRQARKAAKRRARGISKTVPRKIIKKMIGAKFYESREWRELRYDALKKCGRQCLVCGASPPQVVLHVDHIVPISIDPTKATDPRNLQVLCEDCNLGKSNRDSVDWRVPQKDRDQIFDEMFELDSWDRQK